MKLITTGVATVTLAAGVVGSVAAYRSQTTQDVAAPSAAATHAARPVAAEPPRRKVRWAPCPDGSKLEKGVCVTDVVHTVVVAPPAAPAPAPAPAPQAVPVAVNAGGSAGEGREDGRDEGRDEGRDDGDDGGEHESDGQGEHDEGDDD